MSHEGGPESTQQRTVAELLAKYGEQSGERAPRRRRRRPDETTDTAPQAIIERVNSESNKLMPIREDTPPPTRTSHRQQRSGTHQPPSGAHPVPPADPRAPESRRQPPAPPAAEPPRAETRQPSTLEQRLSPPSRSSVPPIRREPPPLPPAKHAPPTLPPAPKLPAIAQSEPTRPVQPPRRERRVATPQPPKPPQPSGSLQQPSGVHPQPTGQHPQPPQAAVPPPVAPPTQNSGTFVRPPAPQEPGKFASGFFATPQQPREEGVTEQIPKVPAGPGNRTGQHPAPQFPPARANFGAPAPEQQRNGVAPDRYPEPDLDSDVLDARYPDEDDDLDEAYDDGFDDQFDDDEPRASSPGREWLVMAGQVAISVIGGAAVWLGFNWLWDKLPQAALGAAIAVIVGLVWIVRKIRRADDLQTTGLAVLVGLFVTVSPAALILLSK
jgi:hypothetical protein